MEKYLEAHKDEIVTFLDLLKKDRIDIPMIEGLLPKSFLKLHEVIT